MLQQKQQQQEKSPSQDSLSSQRASRGAQTDINFKQLREETSLPPPSLIHHPVQVVALPAQLLQSQPTVLYEAQPGQVLAPPPPIVSTHYEDHAGNRYIPLSSFPDSI